jgi:hypothetical protein
MMTMTKIESSAVKNEKKAGFFDFEYEMFYKSHDDFYRINIVFTYEDELIEKYESAKKAIDMASSDIASAREGLNPYFLGSIYGKTNKNGENLEELHRNCNGEYSIVNFYREIKEEKTEESKELKKLLDNETLRFLKLNRYMYSIKTLKKENWVEIIKEEENGFWLNSEVDSIKELMTEEKYLYFASYFKERRILEDFVKRYVKLKLKKHTNVYKKFVF